MVNLEKTRRPSPHFADLLWISIERDGPHASDIYGGDVAMIQVTPNYLTWNGGGHIV